VEGSVATIFQDVTGARFRTDHRSQGREVEAAHELLSLEAALAWAQTRAPHVVLVLSAGAETRRYSAGSAPPPDEPDLPSWPPQPDDPETLPGQDPDARLTPLPGRRDARSSRTADAQKRPQAAGSARMGLVFQYPRERRSGPDPHRRELGLHRPLSGASAEQGRQPAAPLGAG